jgi:tRNA (cytidine32/uridine32-2'-O)-methyltransferase
MNDRTKENITFILCNTSHPGNIGASARAIKNMGFMNLTLVNPCKLDPDAYARAAKADDVLKKSLICPNIEQATETSHYVVAATARTRHINKLIYTPEELSKKIKGLSLQNKVAILFGNERNGLSNHELQYADAIVQIPSDPIYSSLNLASAVQIIAYSLSLAFQEDRLDQKPSTTFMPNPQNLRTFFSNMEHLLQSTQFYKNKNPIHTGYRLRNLLLKAKPTENELSLLYAICLTLKKHKE